MSRWSGSVTVPSAPPAPVNAKPSGQDLDELMPYDEVLRPSVELPTRVRNPDYFRQPVSMDMVVPERY